jgi:putative methionine-R-sulfoxide reductase with GAF domain
MFTSRPIETAEKIPLYADLAQQLAGLLEGERDFIANAANMAALLFNTLPDLNWAGFYLMKSGELVLGPFQGKPACVRIALGKGVCGTAAARRASILVEDVEQFPGHIACDAASRSACSTWTRRSPGGSMRRIRRDARSWSRSSWRRHQAISGGNTFSGHRPKKSAPITRLINRKRVLAV